MPEIKETFWTDDVQAAERLLGCLVRHEDDVIYVDNIEDGKLIGRNTERMDQYEKVEKIKLSDPGFNKFRNLPELGWRNVVLDKGARRKYAGAAYIRRSAVRTRSHGFNRNNTTVYDFYNDSCSKSQIMTIEMAYGKGVKEDMKNPPSFADAYKALSNGTSCALSTKWAIHRDKEGLTWLYRKLKRVALILDNTSLSFLPAADFYIQDAENEPIFKNFVVKGI